MPSRVSRGRVSPRHVSRLGETWPRAGHAHSIRRCYNRRMDESVTSPRPRGIRRFLRFSLRSLMLVTLAIAAWLGYEVHQARTIERQAAAIRALCGEVEFEPSPWSLLRFVEPQTYGWRISSATVSSEH